MVRQIEIKTGVGVKDPECAKLFQHLDLQLDQVGNIT